MLSEFLKDYFPIILFLLISFLLSFGFIIVNFLFSPKNPTLKNFQLMNVALNLLMIQGWNLM